MNTEVPHMNYCEAAAILARLAKNRKLTTDEVTALEMGAKRLLARHFQRARNHLRRAERPDGSGCPGCPGEEGK